MKSADSFESNYLEYVERIYWYIFEMLGDSAEAEELTAQCFLKALKAYAQLKDKERFGPWIFRIARNLSMDFFRRKNRHKKFEEENVTFMASDLLEAAVQSERSRKIQSEIHKFSEADQNLLNLRFIAQLSFREIAVVLRKNESTIKRDYYKLIALLKDSLEEV